MLFDNPADAFAVARGRVPQAVKILNLAGRGTEVQRFSRDTEHPYMSPILEFQGISKSFNRQSVLRELSLSVNPSEFLTLLGPSGSGKTTLLRLAAGFEHPDTGKVVLRGNDISHLPPYRRRVNTVFQNYARFPHLTVFHNVAIGLRVFLNQAMQGSA